MTVIVENLTLNNYNRRWYGNEHSTLKELTNARYYIPRMEEEWKNAVKNIYFPRIDKESTSIVDAS